MKNIGNKFLKSDLPRTLSNLSDTSKSLICCKKLSNSGRYFLCDSISFPFISGFQKPRLTSGASFSERHYRAFLLRGFAAQSSTTACAVYLMFPNSTTDISDQWVLMQVDNN
jgi:hypothetical protein